MPQLPASSLRLIAGYDFFNWDDTDWWSGTGSNLVWDEHEWNYALWDPDSATWDETNWGLFNWG